MNHIRYRWTNFFFSASSAFFLPLSFFFKGAPFLETLAIFWKSFPQKSQWFSFATKVAMGMRFSFQKQQEQCVASSWFIWSVANPFSQTSQWLFSYFKVAMWRLGFFCGHSEGHLLIGTRAVSFWFIFFGCFLLIFRTEEVFCVTFSQDFLYRGSNFLIEWNIAWSSLSTSSSYRLWSRFLKFLEVDSNGL